MKRKYYRQTDKIKTRELFRVLKRIVSTIEHLTISYSGMMTKSTDFFICNLDSFTIPTAEAARDDEIETKRRLYPLCDSMY